MQRNFLINDFKDDVLVNLPSGKQSKKGNWTKIKSQKSITCVFFTLRRLSFFGAPDVESTPEYMAFREIKNTLKSFTNGDYLPVLNVTQKWCAKLGIDAEKTILNSDIFNRAYENFLRMPPQCFSSSAYPRSEFLKNGGLSAKLQWSILFDTLMTAKFLPFFNIERANWHPRDGFEGLKESLRKNGAHCFIGKFGRCFHNFQTTFLPEETTSTRDVFGFPTGSYQGENYAATHAIIVDRVKLVNGKEMVFFRDPYDQSSQGAPEKIYRISYENFVARLTDFQSHRYSLGECANDARFGAVSKNPAMLIELAHFNPADTSSSSAPEAQDRVIPLDNISGNAFGFA